MELFLVRSTINMKYTKANIYTYEDLLKINETKTIEGSVLIYMYVKVIVIK